MSLDNPSPIDELRKAHHEAIIKIEEQIIQMAAQTLDELIALDTRTNAALDVIEAGIAGGLTTDEAGQLNTAMTATAVRAETDAGTNPPAPGSAAARIAALRKR